MLRPYASWNLAWPNSPDDCSQSLTYTGHSKSPFGRRAEVIDPVMPTPWQLRRRMRQNEFYAILRRRRPSQTQPISAEPNSASDAGSGTVELRVNVASKNAGSPLTSEYHKS